MAYDGYRFSAYDYGYGYAGYTADSYYSSNGLPIYHLSYPEQVIYCSSTSDGLLNTYYGYENLAGDLYQRLIAYNSSTGKYSFSTEYKVLGSEGIAYSRSTNFDYTCGGYFSYIENAWANEPDSSGGHSVYRSYSLYGAGTGATLATNVVDYVNNYSGHIISTGSYISTYTNASGYSYYSYGPI